MQKVLWDSAYEVSTPGFVFSKNAPPTIANGRVFVSSFGPMSNIGQQPPELGLVRVFGLGAAPQGFGAPTPWSNIAFYGSVGSSVANPTQLADVDGDGKADGVAFDGTQTWVMRSTGSGFAPPALWSSINFYGLHDGYSTWLGDIDGVNGADAVAFDGTATWVMLSNGSSGGFGAPFVWPGSTVPFSGALAPSVLANSTQLADVNGDGKADAVLFDGATTWVMLSTGSGFGPKTQWSSTNFYGTHDRFSTWLGDVNGDGLADGVAFDGGRKSSRGRCSKS